MNPSPIFAADLVSELPELKGNPVKVRSYPRSCKLCERFVVNCELLIIHHSSFTC
jgi:hypothetical protein